MSGGSACILLNSTSSVDSLGSMKYPAGSWVRRLWRRNTFSSSFHFLGLTSGRVTNWLFWGQSPGCVSGTDWRSQNCFR